MTVVELEATVRLKLPSKSVTVPLVVPFSTTLAPMTGSPVASFTIPETLNLSACRLEALTFIAGMKKQKHSNRLSTRNVLVSVRVFMFIILFLKV